VFVTHDQGEAMEVADQIAVMNAGRIEQVGSPRELYEQPANEFVLRFVGDANRLPDGWVRPHDLELLVDAAEGALEAMVERVVHLGFEVRAELALADGGAAWAQLTRDEAEQLELSHGDVVWVRPRRDRVLDLSRA
jgi:sulfate transport system ATP-binding protein